MVKMNINLFSTRPTASVAATALLAMALFFSGCKKDNNDPNDPGTSSNTPTLQLVADGIASPLGVLESPDETKRLFIIDQTGKIWLVKNGAKQAEPFLDISSKMVSLTPQYDERGLLGMAFHPNFASNGKFYLFYTAPPNAGGPEPGVSWNNLTTIAEYRTGASGADKADA